MRHDRVHGAHLVGALGAVLPGEEEHLARELLADLAGEVGAAVAGVERADVGIRLLEAAVLGARDREVADHVQRVPAAGRPAGDDRDDDLRHEADEPLHLEDVQPPAARRVDALRRSRPSRTCSRRARGCAGRRPQQNAQPPSFGLGPLPVSSTTPMRGFCRASSSARYSSSTVCGRKALRTSGRLKAMRATRPVEVVVVGDVGEALEAGDVAPAAGVEDVGDRRVAMPQAYGLALALAACRGVQRLESHAARPLADLLAHAPRRRPPAAHALPRLDRARGRRCSRARTAGRSSRRSSSTTTTRPPPGCAAAIDFGWREPPRRCATDDPGERDVPAVAAARGRGGARPLPRLPHREGQGRRTRPDARRRRRARRAVRAPPRARGPHPHRRQRRLERRRGRARHPRPRRFDLEYVEQPCATRRGAGRDPRGGSATWASRSPPTRACARPRTRCAVARAGAADLLVIKAQPLGGIHSALRIVAAKPGCPSWSRARSTPRVGIAMGAHLAAAHPRARLRLRTRHGRAVHRATSSPSRSCPWTARIPRRAAWRADAPRSSTRPRRDADRRHWWRRPAPPHARPARPRRHLIDAPAAPTARLQPLQPRVGVQPLEEHVDDRRS